MPAPQQQPIDITPAEAVLEFGPAAPRRRWRGGSDLLRGLAGDQRVVPLAAVLGAVAVLGSLVSEWQVTTVAQGVFGGETGERRLHTEFTDLGVLGTGYLMGVFLLAATVVLTLFGPPAGRPLARLTGLAAGGTMLGLLLALAVSLSGQSRAIPELYNIELDGQELQLTYGRGLWCALIGTLLGLLALHRSARQPHEPVATRRTGHPREADDEQPDGEPLELTVGPAIPFTPADRDRPSASGRRGISG